MAREHLNTPVIGTCIRTGSMIRYPSIRATEAGGFNVQKVRDCLRMRQRHHGGYVWKSDGPMRPSGGNARQIEAGNLARAGMGAKQISERMGVTLNTARNYLSAARVMGVIK